MTPFPRVRPVPHALLWAAIILIAALIMQSLNASDGASFGVIAGLSGAAWGALNSDALCTKGCFE